jgi:hypothetical protein
MKPSDTMSLVRSSSSNDGGYIPPLSLLYIW